MREFRARRLSIVEHLKRGPCLDCGRSFPPECMDFDHVRGTKLFIIAKGSGKPIQTLRDEIAKCDLVCSNCHRTRTRRRRQASMGEQAVV